MVAVSDIAMLSSRMQTLLVRMVRILELRDWSPRGVHLAIQMVPLPVQETVLLQQPERPTRAHKRSHLSNGNGFKRSMSHRRLQPRACWIQIQPRVCYVQCVPIGPSRLRNLKLRRGLGPRRLRSLSNCFQRVMSWIPRKPRHFVPFQHERTISPKTART